MVYVMLESFVCVLAVFGFAVAMFVMYLALVLTREGLAQVAGVIPKAVGRTSLRALARHTGAGIRARI